MLYSTIGGASNAVKVSRLCLGTMYFGTRTDASVATAILDRFVENGGTLIDTADCYNQWVGARDGGESEELIGRWLRSRQAFDDVVVATKIGARTTVIGEPVPSRFEGLSGATIPAAAQRSLRRLGLEEVPLLYAHIDDRSVPLEETVAALSGLVDAGFVRVLGASNTATWRVERARRIAEDFGGTGYTCVQQAGSYLWPHPAPSQLHVITDELLDYAEQNSDISVMAYTPLLAGAYADRRRALPGNYEHASSRARLAVLDSVAEELGATPGQVALSWLMNGPVPVIPVVGASSVEQIDEAIAAVDLKIPGELRARLDEAH